MRELSCKHCNGEVYVGDQKCPNCGMPLPSNLTESPRKRFIVWFIILTLFCIAMIIWLPQLN